ncbi:MAG: TVP38/TMEM64 family protein [Gemmatimonadaceae bacterium]
MRSRAAARTTTLAALIVAAGALAFRLGLFDYDRLAAFAATIRHSRDVAGVAPAFVAAYALATGAGLPATPPTLAGGAMFGAALGTLLSWLGALGGAAIGYWLARGLGAPSVQRYLCRHAQLRRLADQERGFWAMLRLRLIPVIPLGMLSFGAGLARLPFGPYMAATAIGLLPGTAIYSYFADQLLSHVASAEHAAWWRLSVACVLLLILSFLPALLRKRGTGVEEAPEEALASR